MKDGYIQVFKKCIKRHSVSRFWTDDPANFYGESSNYFFQIFQMPDSGDMASAISDVKFSICLKNAENHSPRGSLHEKTIGVLIFLKKHLTFYLLLIFKFYCILLSFYRV